MGDLSSKCSNTQYLWLFSLSTILQLRQHVQEQELHAWMLHFNQPVPALLELGATL